VRRAVSVSRFEMRKVSEAGETTLVTTDPDEIPEQYREMIAPFVEQYEAGADLMSDDGMVRMVGGDLDWGAVCTDDDGAQVTWNYSIREGGARMCDETTHVVFGWDGDQESWYVYEASEGEGDGTFCVYEADIPKLLMDRVKAAFAEVTAAVNAAAEAAGADLATSTLREPCAKWNGERYPLKRWFDVAVPASSEEGQWPVIDASVSHCASREEAEAFVASLPETFLCVAGAGSTGLARRDQLTITEKGYGGTETECLDCGWPRQEHPGEDAG